MSRITTYPSTIRFRTIVVVVFTLGFAWQCLAQDGQRDIKWIGHSLDSINTSLNNEAQNDSVVVRNIFNWITNTIAYDYRHDGATLLLTERSKLLNTALLYNSGVCAHYAVLFDTLCALNNIESHIINGYVYDTTDIQLSHAWNAVMLDNEYRLVDATWSAGFMNADSVFIRQISDKYYLTKPEDFVRDHMPFDPAWQLLEYPMSNADFLNQRFEPNNEAEYFSFRDTISSYLGSSMINRAKQQKRRMAKNGIENELILSEYNLLCQNYNRMVYNHYIQSFNNGIHSWNRYINAKSTYFKNPKMSVTAIEQVFNSAYVNIAESFREISKIQSTDSTLCQEKDDFLSHQDEMKYILDLERQFVEDYAESRKLFGGLIW